mmetsp:Transcript_7495/g.12035  ORF Transcript_7495/g.12035 Transcript_7495/m.12035 type:complete len:939 (+) Transcript_7495:30-2846(+)|eukprot:CAMPEP_0203759276 /NCGR_PEP_ID=MMETSP0098-20131031/12212_1 /ASSEMBLY_ACC=CAM_ASM_000208 /TAXON_ID=96639 /ORGANISM=" , Strain NY0313808BC1" /LENGTH=938 /DNA_ID=CAMNT_0050652095 /DNA_START=48 /DNA_END=2864 /DNA_ORIENTATION=-
MAARFDGRLPRHLVPEEYWVDWDVDVDANVDDFRGIVQVRMQLLEEADEIFIHAVDLKLDEVTVTVEGRSYVSHDQVVDRVNEVVCLKFSEIVPMTKDARLRMSFQGVFRAECTGLSKCAFDNNATGEREHFIFTQFQPTLARCALPCFDEPGLKACFNLSVFVYSSSGQALEEWVVLGNTEVEKESVEEKGCYSGKLVQFKASPKMSSYLLTFCVGKLTYIEDTLCMGGDEIRMRFYAPRGNEQKLIEPLEHTKKSVEFYTDFYGVPFPLSKLDSVANPGFPGGMENWGLIWYCESTMYNLEKAIKFNDTTTETGLRKFISHEVGHQWFGNLVTMEWWDDLWLNEAFTEWSAYKALEHILPDFDISRHIYEGCILNSMPDDSRASSHAVRMELKSSRDIASAFDSVTYKKGCALINMLGKWVGDQALKEGLRHYFGLYAYKATTTDQLWQVLETKSRVDICPVLDSFTFQKGLPVVEVERASSGCLRFSQAPIGSKFGNEAEDPERLWHIPVTLKYGSGNTHEFILNSKTAVIQVPGLKPTDWIKVNTGQTGFYRVHYSQELLESLLIGLQTCNERVLSDLDIAGVLIDLTELCKLGFMSVRGLICQIKVFAAVAGNSVLVWQTIIQVLDIVYKWVASAGGKANRKPEKQRLWKHVTQWAGEILQELKQKFISNKRVVHAADLPKREMELMKATLEQLVRFEDDDTMEALSIHMDMYLCGQIEPDSILPLCYLPYVGSDNARWLCLFKRMYLGGDPSTSREGALKLLGSCTPSREAERFLLSCLLVAWKPDISEAVEHPFRDVLNEIQKLPLVEALKIVFGIGRSNTNEEMVVLDFFETYWEELEHAYEMQDTNVANPLKFWFTSICHFVWETQHIDRLEKFVNSEDPVLPPTADGKASLIRDHCESTIKGELEALRTRNMFFTENHQDLLDVLHTN